jgi:hypothetical protein
MMRLGLMVLVFALAACNYGTPIYLKNAELDQMVVCGPYPHADTAAAEQQTCLEKALAEGYTRVRN